MGKTINIIFKYKMADGINFHQPKNLLISMHFFKVLS